MHRAAGRVQRCLPRVGADRGVEVDHPAARVGEPAYAIDQLARMHPLDLIERRGGSLDALEAQPVALAERRLDLA